MEAEGDRDRHTQYVVLSRACADFYEEMVAVFANWSDIEVVVDGRREPRSSLGFVDSVVPISAKERLAPKHSGSIGK